MSNNKLLSVGSVMPEVVPVGAHRERTNKRTPCLRYHKELGSKLCSHDDVLDGLGEGWVDHPGKLRRLPGHEKLYDAYIAGEPKKVITGEEFLVVTDEVKQQRTKDEADANVLKLKNENAIKQAAVYAASLIHQCPSCELKFDTKQKLYFHKLKAHKEVKPVINVNPILAEEPKPL